MNDSDPVLIPSSLMARAKAILLTPREEWPRIAAEPATIGSLYTGWVVILAAIPAICGLIGALLFGYSMMGISYRPSAGAAISTALVGYVLSLVQVYVLALIIDALAPTFAGTRDRVQAFKLAAYAATAGWVGGLFQILPAIAPLGMIAALYSIYLLYVGLPLLMRAPQEKAVGYTVVTIIAAILIGIATMMIAGPIAGLFGGPMNPAGGGMMPG